MQNVAAHELKVGERVEIPLVVTVIEIERHGTNYSILQLQDDDGNMHVFEVDGGRQMNVVSRPDPDTTTTLPEVPIYPI